MSLLINQGKQQVNNNQILEVNDANCIIDKVKMHPSIGGALLVTFKIIDGQLKGRFFCDTVNYDPDNKMAWKYTHLRNCIGAPYKENESPHIDIEKLFLGKCVLVDLTKRIDNSGNERQNCKYKKPSVDPAHISVVANNTKEEVPNGWDEVKEPESGNMPF